jgi:hypothetical protein
MDETVVNGHLGDRSEHSITATVIRLWIAAIAQAAVGGKRRLAGWLAELNDISLRIKAIAYVESLKEPLFVG